MATTALLRLAALTGEGRYRMAAEAALSAMGHYLDRHPTAFAQWLSALELAHAEPTEVAVVGNMAEPATQGLVATIDRGYHPFRVQASSSSPESSSVPLLHGRFALDGRPTAFVCHGFACRLPVTEPEALEALLVGG